MLDDFDRSILFLDDDFREVGEAMLKTYQRGSNRMMNPKLILRIRDVLSLPEVAQINRAYDPEYQKLADWFRRKLGKIVLGDGRIECDWSKANTYSLSNMARRSRRQKSRHPRRVDSLK